MSQGLFEAIGISSTDQKSINSLAKQCGMAARELRFLDDSHLLPIDAILERIALSTGVSELSIRLKMGLLDRELRQRLASRSDEIEALLGNDSCHRESCAVESSFREPDFSTELGALHQMDCIDYLQTIASQSIDMVFADPPFNLKKLYPSKINDDLRREKYLDWCEQWLGECIRVMKDGGSLFLWNLPRWNLHLGDFLSQRLRFRHWIAVDVRSSLPIQGRLYPSHYSLLYFVKGPKPSSFFPDRLPMQVCKKCGADQKDYGGYKAKMNPNGVNLADVWIDISPVRHAKYKKRKSANELPVKLMDRIIEMSTKEGDLVLDPFGGSGTTYAVSEIKNRRWTGCELGPLNDIVDRFSDLEHDSELLEKTRTSLNQLFTKDTLKLRHRSGLWTAESVRAADQQGLHQNGNLDLEGQG